jgi:D-alanine-D-alanine ligase
MAMNKRVSKVLFERGGIATPAWGMVAGLGASPVPGRHTAPSFESDFSREGAADLIADLGGFPVVVKPSDQGSTVGLTVVNEERRLSEAIDAAARFSQNVLVERYIPGREVTVSVLGVDPLPVVEIVPRKGIYDYESKYTKGMSEYRCPADLPDPVAGELAQLAVRAFGALGCRGYARADFRLTADYQPYCLEVNTLPGMTDVSLVPMAAAAVGISFLDLIERITRSALE